jgi:hypothetical protein
VSEKTAGQTQVAWALLTQGVSEARLDAHRIRHLLERVLRLIEDSDAKEHIYEVAGDIIQAAPRKFDHLETVLDRTSYALSVLGEDHLRERLPMEDRALVDQAVHKARPFVSPHLQRATSRVAYAYMMRHADLMPPLGFPGGICHVTNRIFEEVRDPKLRDELVDDVEQGKKLTNQDAHQVYELEMERGVGKFKQLQITPHAQYRMDQRGVTVTEIRLGLKSFQKRWNDLRSQKAPQARSWEMDMMRGEPLMWTDPQIHLTIVFMVQGQDRVRLVTTYWEGQPDPKPQGRTCPAPR